MASQALRTCGFLCLLHSTKYFEILPTAVFLERALCVRPLQSSVSLQQRSTRDFATERVSQTCARDPDWRRHDFVPKWTIDRKRARGKKKAAGNKRIRSRFLWSH